MICRKYSSTDKGSNRLPGKWLSIKGEAARCNKEQQMRWLVGSIGGVSKRSDVFRTCIHRKTREWFTILGSGVDVTVLCDVNK
jgi:hypothetical protein